MKRFKTVLQKSLGMRLEEPGNEGHLLVCSALSMCCFSSQGTSGTYPELMNSTKLSFLGNLERRWVVYCRRRVWLGVGLQHSLLACSVNAFTTFG